MQIAYVYTAATLLSLIDDSNLRDVKANIVGLNLDLRNKYEQ